MANSSKRKMTKIFYMTNSWADSVDSDLYKVTAMLNISRIFQADNVEEAVGGLISLYALMSHEVFEVNEHLSTLTVKEFITLRRIRVTCRHDIVRFLKFPDSESNERLLKHLNISSKATSEETLIFMKPMLQIFTEKFLSLNFDVSSIVLYTGLCLILMCKKLDKFNYSSWLKSKWNSFLGTVGLNRMYSQYGPSQSLFPRLKLCRNIYTFFSQHQHLRRILFVGIMKLSTQTGIWSNMCRTVLRLSKGAEMNHICLINTYILQDHPELIEMNELRPEMLKLQSAYKEFFNMDLPEEQWPYLKIMTIPTNSAFNKSNFPLLTYIAVQIGKKIQPSLSSYTSIVSPENKSATEKALNLIYNENSLSCYIRSQTQYENSHIFSKNISKLLSGEFTDLLKVSDSLEKSLHQSLGINLFCGRDSSLKYIVNALPTIKITYLKINKDADVKTFKLACLLSIAKVYDGDRVESIIGSMLTLIANTDFHLFSSDKFKMAFKEHGFELDEIHIESTIDVVQHFKFTDQEMNSALLRYYGRNDKTPRYCSIHGLIEIKKVSLEFKEKFLSNIDVTFSSIFDFIGLYLTLMFKQLNEVSYPVWVLHKLDTFQRVIEKSFQESNSEKLSTHLPCSSMIPSLETSQEINCFFSANFLLRKLIFLRILELVDLKHILSWTSLMVGQLAKGTEMNHIFLINNLIVKQHSVLLKMKELKPELLRYLNMLEAIQNKEVEEKNWPFLKIILNPAEVEFLNKNNFPLLTYLAEFWNQKVNKKNYIGRETVTPYMKTTAKITSDFYNIYCEAFANKILNYFKLNALNGDLLSTLEGERLKNLYVISEILQQSLKSLLGTYNLTRSEQIKNITIDKAKSELSVKLIL